MTDAESVCPGCGLVLKSDEATAYGGYHHASPECWQAWTAHHREVARFTARHLDLE